MGAREIEEKVKINRKDGLSEWPHEKKNPANQSEISQNDAYGITKR